ncbi:MAG: hypothetical protein IT364_14895 [Candidatus Hydrogenedentes bacterium]|nr:hypothetical protein [Candidatus Hydrogenedentota bacterium]
MYEPHSQILGPRAVRALERLGDIIVPRVGSLPAFSELGCVEHVDSVLAYAPREDVASLKNLLDILYFVPDSLLKLLICAMAKPEKWPAFVATNLRLLDMGVRGVVLSLYYSGRTGATYEGPTPHELMGYEIRRIPRDALT